MLMCKTLNGNGVLRNEEGVAFNRVIDFNSQRRSDENFKLINEAFADGYMFWDWNNIDGPKGSKKGQIWDCLHVPRVLYSEKETSSVKWYKPQDFTATTSVSGSGNANVTISDIKTATDGRPLATVNSIISLRRLGYFEYMPFASRMSNFYVKGWRDFDVQADPATGFSGISLITGFGTNFANSLHFLSQPLGYYVMPPQSTVTGTSIYSGIARSVAEDAKKSENLFGMELTSTLNEAYEKAIVDIPVYDYDPEATEAGEEQPINKCTSWSVTDSELSIAHHVDCATADDALADRVYTHVNSKTGKVHTNVVNRMMQQELSHTRRHLDSRRSSLSNGRIS